MLTLLLTQQSSFSGASEEWTTTLQRRFFSLRHCHWAFIKNPSMILVSDAESMQGNPFHNDKHDLTGLTGWV